jgi:hypothetical protein
MNIWIPASPLLACLLALPVPWEAVGADDPKPESAVASDLVGAWTTAIHNQYGDWTLTFKVELSGAYRTLCKGPAPLPDDIGHFAAQGGKWQVRKASGETDQGTYVLSDQDTLSLTGKAGTLTWKRLSRSPASPAASEAPSPKLPDERVLGTWENHNTLGGKTTTSLMRLDADLQYRRWVLEAPEDPGSSGTFRVEDQTLHIRKADGTRMSTGLSLEGPDTLYLCPKGRSPQKYARRRDDPKAPAEGTGGKELSLDDRNDPEKCFAEGRRLYRAENMKEAVVWFLFAAQMGHARAQLQIGWHYEMGLGVRRNFASAANWYRQSAEQGDGQGMSNLGTLYESGLGVGEDWVEAARWYGLGAEKGNAQAWVHLAQAYRYGLGVGQDRGRAIGCYRRAVALGDKSQEEEAHWLECPSNCVGFLSEEERATVIRRLPRSSELWGDMGSAGLLFHDSRERMKWALKLQKNVTDDEAEIDRMAASWFNHHTEVERLVREGYSRSEAESRARW